MARFIIAYKKKKQIKLQVSGVEEYAQSHSADYTGANGIYIANSDKEDGTQDYIHTNGKYSISRTLRGDENVNLSFSWWFINKLEINDGSFLQMVLQLEQELLHLKLHKFLKYHF